MRASVSLGTVNRLLVMKKPISLLLLIIVVALQSDFSWAADNECETDYGFEVAFCSQAFDKLDITPKQRAEYQKACIANAQAYKATCETGTNACLDACTATYNDSVAACEATYNAAVIPCGGDILCLAPAASNRAVCISAVTDALNTCNQACGLDEWTVESADVRACTPEETKKTTICHIPPGNPANAHTLCIGTRAVKHHLQNHGDYLGPCNAE